jgi:hypothetical protein
LHPMFAPKENKPRQKGSQLHDKHTITFHVGDSFDIPGNAGWLAETE